MGNFYTNLWPSSVAAGRGMLSSLEQVVTDITAMHAPLFAASLVDWMADSMVASLHHIRSAFWLKDGRWRQWEAYDCVNVDSIHNDGERHIPYVYRRILYIQLKIGNLTDGVVY